jgi:hypothetical protein
MARQSYHIHSLVRFAGLESMLVIVTDWRYVHQSTISRSSVRAKPTPTSDTCTGHEAEPNFTNYKYYCSSTVIQRAAFEKAKDLEGAQFLTWCCSSWSSGWMAFISGSAARGVLRTV